MQVMTGAVDAGGAEEGLLVPGEEPRDLLESPAPGSGRRRNAVAARALLSAALVAAVLLVLAARRTVSPANAGTPAATAATSLEEVACSSPGQNCADSKCCVDGGAEGLRCYLKNENWGECMEVGTCEPGVHKGEKHGHWSAAGVFIKDKWSCDPAGDASKPGCESYEEKEDCPAGRCSWGSGKCQAKCSSFADEGACWKADYCMYAGGKCEEACWEFKDEEKCGSLDRCMWQEGGEKGGKCMVACNVHAVEDACPHKDRCIWTGGKCAKDPCSAPWEDCRATRCCSAARGGTGMTCFEKDESYATCLDTPDEKVKKGWSGKKLGNRTKFISGCSWAGEDCTSTKVCCNEGFNCAVKDSTFSGCVQALKISTWNKMPVKMPAGWKGTKLGGWRSEYQVQPAPQGGAMAGTSFYCLMAVLPNSTEMQLLDTAKKNNASIFACNDSSVFHSWKTTGADWDTGATTLVNTAVFLKIFDLVKEEGKYLKYDWTIKVDADCVFIPWRLREHIWGLRPPANTPMYLKNNDLQGLGNAGFLGAVEVFSKQAMQIYFDNSPGCAKYLGTNSGEDGFFKGCMDALGIGFLWDKSMFTPNYDPATCTNSKYAAYHPIKFPTHWQRCWDIATGKMCQGLTYDCGGPLDPPVSSLGVR